MKLNKLITTILLCTVLFCIPGCTDKNDNKEIKTESQSIDESKKIQKDTNESESTTEETKESLSETEDTEEEITTESNAMETTTVATTTAPASTAPVTTVATVEATTELATEKQTEPETTVAQIPKVDSWVITQYADKSGNQAMFYTIYNGVKDVLIVIDGGWTQNTDYVRNTILSMGGHVNAWIVTHYHNDHVNAVNGVLSDPRGITVDAIYDSPMNYDEYLSVAKAWDSPGSYTKYLEITKSFNSVHHLYKGDSFNISELNFTVFSSYDEISVSTGDIPNNAGLVFKVTGPGKSMLFCSDVHTNGMEHYLIDTYGDALKADYLQPGHHGNNSYDNELYDLVSPSYVFIDGPNWLLYGDSYTTKNLLNYCTEKGIPYCAYATAPNMVTLD